MAFWRYNIRNRVKGQIVADFIGTIIRDYLIKAYVGKGGHGAVYRAEVLRTGAVVAIKVLLPEHSEDTELAQRLQQEADIIRDLRHPHIVPLLETWKDEMGIWLVMPWMGGGDLREQLEKNGAMKVEALNLILQQICSALDAAHAAHIIHRDFKPDNVLLDEAGQAYLSDFGVAKRTNYSGITSIGTIIGSPHYLSPEQIMGEEISNRSDIYSLGVTIFELLTGATPFQGTTSRLQLIMKVMRDNLPFLTEHEIPEKYLDKINGLIQRCTAKDPQDRYPTASSVAAHFQEILSEN
jgi:serine/threonine protein kinase